MQKEITDRQIEKNQNRKRITESRMIGLGQIRKSWLSIKETIHKQGIKSNCHGQRPPVEVLTELELKKKRGKLTWNLKEL